MNNKFQDYIDALFIDKKEYDEFLVAIQHYYEVGIDTRTALIQYVNTNEPSSIFKKRLLTIITEIENKGEGVLAKRLLENGILKTKNEEIIFSTSDNKSKAISLILESRLVGKPLTQEMTMNYVYHILAALTYMSWYLVEDYYIDSIVEMGTMLNDTKEGIYIKPTYWIPFEVFLPSTIYFLWAIYNLFIIHLGKYLNYKVFYTVQKHQETNDLIHALKLVQGQISVGYNFHESLKNVINSIAPSVQKVFKRSIKDFDNGLRNFSKNFKNIGFSDSVVSALKMLDSGADIRKTIPIILAVLGGRREKIKMEVTKTKRGNALFAFTVANAFIGVLVVFEMYRAAIIGINIR